VSELRQPESLKFVKLNHVNAIVAVIDLPAATAFFEDALGASTVYRDRRPSIPPMPSA
jgi:catechol 2,3-dioxygenase-like lactoylglutathione lyase family enzyme